jgi:hypothetical protein
MDFDCNKLQNALHICFRFQDKYICMLWERQHSINIHPYIRPVKIAKIDAINAIKKDLRTLKFKSPYD